MVAEECRGDTVVLVEGGKVTSEADDPSRRGWRPGSTVVVPRGV